jgi:hypothetical protein
MLCVRDTIGGTTSLLTLPTPGVSPLTLPIPSLPPVGEWSDLGGDDPPFTMVVLGFVVSCSCVGDPVVLGTLDSLGVPLPGTPIGGGVGALGLLVPPVDRCIAVAVVVMMGWKEEGGCTDREV